MINLIKKKIKNYYIKKHEQKKYETLTILHNPKISDNEKWIVLQQNKNYISKSCYLTWHNHLKNK